MGVCGWDTCRNGPSNVGRMRFRLGTPIRRRLIRPPVFYEERYHIGFVPTRLSRCIRPNTPGSEWLSRHSPNNNYIQRYMSLPPHPSHPTSDMGAYAYPRLSWVHPNRLCLQSAVRTSSMGIHIRIIRSGDFRWILGLPDCFQEDHGRFREATIRIGVLARDWVLDRCGECPDIWKITDKSAGL